MRREGRYYNIPDIEKVKQKVTKNEAPFFKIVYWPLDSPYSLTELLLRLGCQVLFFSYTIYVLASYVCIYVCTMYVLMFHLKLFIKTAVGHIFP